MPKYPLPPGDMSSGVAYPTNLGTGIQGMHLTTLLKIFKETPDYIP